MVIFLKSTFELKTDRFILYLCRMLTKSDRTKQHIVEQAAGLFNRKGFAGTSMSDIMEATGLTKGGLYGNFESKELIAIQAFDYAFGRVMEELTFKLRQQDKMADKLHALCDYYRNYSVHSPVEGGCPIMNFGLEADDTFPELRKRVAAAIDRQLNDLERIIRAGQKKGELKPDIDPELTANLIYTQIDGAIMMAKTTGQHKRLNRVLDYLKNWIDTELKV